MRSTHLYIGSFFLAAALAAPVAMVAAPAPNDAGVQVRVYDRDHRDYHNWDDREDMLMNTLGRTGESGQNTGIGAIPIQTATSEGIHSARDLVRVRRGLVWDAADGAWDRPAPRVWNISLSIGRTR
jgi:hypothetical protein